MSLAIAQYEGTLVVDSRLIAEELGIEHKAFLETLKKHQTKIEERFGIITFETEKIGGRGRPEKYALLTEPQATILMTFSRNTEQVVDCKLKLVEAFEKAKQVIKEVAPQQQKPEYALTPDNALNVIDLILKGSGVDPKLISGLKANVISKEFPQLKGVAEQAKLLLPVEVEDRLVRVTDLALEYANRSGQNLSARAMNQLLESRGFQVRNLNSNPNWIPTEKGKPYSKVVLQEARDNNSTVQQLRWYMSVLEAV